MGHRSPEEARAGRESHRQTHRGGGQAWTSLSRAATSRYPTTTDCTSPRSFTRSNGTTTSSCALTWSCSTSATRASPTTASASRSPATRAARSYARRRGRATSTVPSTPLLPSSTPGCGVSRTGDGCTAAGARRYRSRRRRQRWPSGPTSSSETPCRSGRRRTVRYPARSPRRSEKHTSELQSRPHLVCRLLLEKKKNNKYGQATCTQTTTNNKQRKKQDH